MAIGAATTAEVGKSDPILTRLASEDTVPWYRKPNLRHLYLMLFPTCMGIELTSGFDSQMINALQIVPSWVSYFGNPQGSLKGIIAAAYSLGAILSLPLVPIVNDRFGRRWSIFGGSAIMIVGAIIQGLSQHVAMYIVARMILGFGIPTCIVAGSSLIGELAHPKERAVLTSLFNVSYFVGQIAAAAVCFGTNSIADDRAWRVPSLLQLCPSLLQLCLVMRLPESPRWLITRGRAAEAEAVLARYHGEGQPDGAAFVRAELAQIVATMELERAAAASSRWRALLAAGGMRRRLLITVMLGLFTQWSGNTLISYYLGDLLRMIGLTSSVDSQKINVSIACWSLVCGATVALLVGRVRRRVMYLLCTCSLLLCYSGWTVAMKFAQTAADAGTPNGAANTAVLFFIYAYSPCYNMGYNALTYTYMVELWPYTERSKGIAVFQLFGRLSGFFTTFVNPIGLDSVGWKYLISYCCWLAFEVTFVYFMFPETFGRTLEELAFIFEDKKLSDEAVKATEKALAHGGSVQGTGEKGAATAELVESRAS